MAPKARAKLSRSERGDTRRVRFAGGDAIRRRCHVAEIAHHPGKGVAEPVARRARCYADGEVAAGDGAGVERHLVHVRRQPRHRAQELADLVVAGFRDGQSALAARELVGHAAGARMGSVMDLLMALASTASAPTAPSVMRAISSQDARWSMRTRSSAAGPSRCAMRASVTRPKVTVSVRMSRSAAAATVGSRRSFCWTFEVCRKRCSASGRGGGSARAEPAAATSASTTAVTPPCEALHVALLRSGSEPHGPEASAREDNGEHEMEHHVVAADGHDTEEHGREHAADGEDEIRGAAAEGIGDGATGAAAGPDAPHAKEHVHDVMERVHGEDPEEHVRRHVHHRVSGGVGNEAESGHEEEEDSGHGGHSLNRRHRQPPNWRSGSGSRRSPKRARV